MAPAGTHVCIQKHTGCHVLRLNHFGQRHLLASEVLPPREALRRIRTPTLLPSAGVRKTTFRPDFGVAIGIVEQCRRWKMRSLCSSTGLRLPQLGARRRLLESATKFL